jgi:hypothetical protein
MERGRRRIPRFRLTLGQMMKLVIFAAVACAAVAPVAQLKQYGVIHDWTAVLIWASVAAPLACAVTLFPVIRRGPLRDWLIRVFLLVSVSAALGYALYFVGWEVFLVMRWGQWLYGFSWLEAATVVPVLSLAFIFLLWRVVPGWCPDCRLPMLVPEVCLRDATGTRPANASRCLACGGQYKKHASAWRPLPPDALP